MGIDIKEYKSHSEKLLQDHLSGVIEKVKYRTANLSATLNLKLAEIAALFHDVGKINPNFQEKLLTGKSYGYSSHAYLSAYAFWCFCRQNQKKVLEWITRKEQCFSLLALLARHHGNLPNFEEGILNSEETEKLAKFLEKNPSVPISEFLQEFKTYKTFSEFLNEHESFTLDTSSYLQEKFFKVRVLEPRQPLEFFLETQFCFACLLEADKRDAADNQNYKRENLRRSYFEQNFSPKIEAKLQEYAEKQDKTSLDILRTAMRDEAVKTLREVLNEDKRVFALAAPTGAGKTLMLLALAKEIFLKNPHLSVIYTLPFLSITEQVETICREIFDDNVLRIDSRSENREIQNLQEKLDDEQTDENVKKLIQESFTETTFDHPFIVTTFQQVFETLLSNRNAQLLRLPNFSKTIFLIDEIQALPYRLYTFFTALLDEFCRRFDSYAIISTATMPHFDFPSQETEGRKLFANYQKPIPLLDAPKFFGEKVFNRYRVKQIKQENFQVKDLADLIIDCDESALVILNTIDDTKQLYDLLLTKYGEEECLLLNTHFTLKDRRTKIWLCKRRLKKNQKIILISTQLVEAGVDIDFPTVFRDFCPLPNLIQSAGRCNRNGIYEFGDVFFFVLRKENGKPCSELIYRNEAKNFLDFCRNELPESFTESELFEIQQKFFQKEVGEKLKFGEHLQSNCADGDRQGILNLVKCINKAAFETLGRFRLIDEREFGYEFRYYIPNGSNDEEFEKLVELAKTAYSRNFEEAKQRQIKIETQLRKMSDRMVTFRLRNFSDAPAWSNEVFSTDKYVGIRELADLTDYSFQKGINISPHGGCII
jgi:CRISPR-associated helicase Cas3/CRISPR-associated endonuclease Cas3-HD